jgi:hypothetical protein
MKESGKIMPATNYQRLTKGIRWSARVISIAITSFFLMFVIGEGIDAIINEGFGAIGLEGIFVGLPFFIALAGCVVSWWWEWLAALLLILAYLMAGLRPALYTWYLGRGISIEESFRASLQWWIMTLPLFVAAVLFFIAWRLSKKIS